MPDPGDAFSPPSRGGSLSANAFAYSAPIGLPLPPLVHVPPGAATVWIADLLDADLARISTLLFGGVVLAASALAFLGFSVSNWWTDELFTLFLVDHHGGLAEVTQRALTDTHPPAYYYLLYLWKSAFGLNEVSARALSALCAVGAVLAFVAAARGAFSRAAVAFAAAVASTGGFWFFQAQNARNYPLCLLLGALMLVGAVRLRRETLDGRTAWLTAAGVAAAGALTAFSHFYGLLTTGFVFGWLILTLPDWRLRGALAAAGLAILGGEVAYMHALSGHTQQNFGELWFTNDIDDMVRVIRDSLRAGVAANVLHGLTVLLLIAIFKRPTVAEQAAIALGDEAAERRWLIGLGAFVIVGVYMAGVAISLLYTPSISAQNVLIASPFLWLLWAALFERAYRVLGPRARPWVCALMIGLVSAQVVTQAAGRLSPRNEQWRASADYIARIPACDGAPIPVVRPYKFGPDTPFFRELTSRWFFGRFLPNNRLIVRSPEAFLEAGVDPAFNAFLAARANDPAACPVLAWAVHDIGRGDAETLQRAMQRLPGVDPAFVQMRSFPHYERDGLRWERAASGYVLLAARAPRPLTLAKATP